MTEKQLKDTERWIRQQCNKKLEDGDVLTGFQLRSMAMGTKGAAIDDIDLPDGLTNDNIAILAEDIISRAQQDADAMGKGSKAVRYTILPMVNGKAGNGIRLALRLFGNNEGDESQDEGVEGEETPDGKGLATQLMRHNEALMRLTTMSMGGVIQHLTTQLTNTTKALNEAHDQRMKDRIALEEAASQTHQRDMEMMMMAGEEDRKKLMFEKAQSLFPVLLNKLSGQKAVPQGSAGNLLRSLANTFTSEQIQGLAPLLSQEQQVMFFTLLKEIGEEQQKEQANGVH